jgi:hypothetical protein
VSFCCIKERTTDVPTTPVGLRVAIPAFREMVIASFVRLWAEFRVTSHYRCIFSTPFTQVLACDPQQRRLSRGLSGRSANRPMKTALLCAAVRSQPD